MFGIWNTKPTTGGSGIPLAIHLSVQVRAMNTVTKPRYTADTRRGRPERRKTPLKRAAQRPVPRGLDHLTEALRASWRRETSYDPTGWSTANPSWGQCAVTSLVVQDLLGGRLVTAPILGHEHFWNRLEGNLEVDLTREQFGQAVPDQSPQEADREFVLSFPDTLRRYELLRDEVHECLTDFKA